jgi:hypothetical protein
MANRTRAQLSTDSLGYFPDNTSQLITPADLRDWITNGIESFVTQKDTSEFQNAFYECRGSAITATSGTTNLALAGGNFVHITGSGPISITSFGTLPAGSRFVLCFDIPVTIVYNATTLIIPGAANIVTVAGDCIMLISEGSGAWRLIGYFPSTGLPVGTVTAVTASAPLSSTGGNAPDLSIPQANGTTDGFLNSADWTTFNGKQDALTLTTTGTSGPATLTGATLNIPQYSGGGGGTPGGVDTEIQYNNGGAFGGVSDLTWDDINNQLTIKNPRIGQSVGNGHFHMHNSTSGPPGIADYLTVNWEKSNRSVGFRYEQETFLSYLKFLQPTANRTYTLPDASGNVLVDTVLPSLTNGTSEGQIRLKEAVANGTNYIALKAPATVAADTTFTLPNSDGTPGTVIQTNGSGILSWVNNGGATALQFLKNTTGTIITNPTGNTILETLTIPAGTFTSNNAFLLTVRWLSTVTVTTSSWYISINTTPTIGGVNVLGPSTVGAGNATQNGIRAFYLFGGGSGNTTRYMDSPFVSSTAAMTVNTAIDWSITQYIVVWFTASNNRNFQNVIISTTPI